MITEGQTIGWWTIKKYLGVNHKQERIWECQCKCGAIKKRTTGVVNAHSKYSCGCLKIDTYGDIGGYLWSNIKISAKRRRIPFTITSQDAWTTYQNQGGICALSGRVLYFADQNDRFDKQTASLDRIDSSKPYELGNIQWIHKDVNIIKGKLTVEDLLYYCGLLTKPATSVTISIDVEICNGLWYGLIGNAGKRNLPVEFDKAFLVNLFKSQNGCCNLTHIPLTLPETTTKFRKFEHTASLDRIDSQLGYIPGNIQWIHKTINSMKMHLNQDYFLQTCKEISDYNR